MAYLAASAFIIFVLYLYNELECSRLQILQEAFASLATSTEVMSPGPSSRKMKRKLRYTCTNRKRARTRKLGKRNRCTVDADEIFDRTGVFEDAFLEYYDKLAPIISQPRIVQAGSQSARHVTASLDGMSRLQLVLEYLRHSNPYKNLAQKYAISVAQVSREVRFLLPLILSSLDELPTSIPNNLVPHEFEAVVGALDCTCHYRWRVHPCQGDWYRGDKHAFFISGKFTIELMKFVFLNWSLQLSF